MWHTSSACFSVGGGWEEEGRRRSGRKNCNLTPTFSLPSFLFTSQTHQGWKVTFFAPRRFSNWSIYIQVELTSCFLSSARLLFSSGVLRLTGTPRQTCSQTHTRTDICGSTGYCETWSHADASPRSLRQRFNELSAWLTATQATKGSTSVLLCTLQVWLFVCR